MNKGITESIERTKQGFEESFKVGDFYNMQTQDDKHLKSIMDFLQLKEGMKILDLGTGTGYLAFKIAIKHPQSEVVGLDIVENTLCENSKRAAGNGVKNLSFLNYDGINFPFADSFFDMVVSRYALHHFPVILDTFKEISRVLKHTGTLFLSDPAPNDNDEKRFVDAYMQMKKDGHIQFYTKDEWKEIGKKEGLFYIKGFETSIRFPRKRDTAIEFNDIVSRFDNEVIKGYHLKSIKDEIWITEKVNNLLLGKSQKMEYRELKTGEVSKALELVWQVFLQYEAPDYSKEGIDEFEKSIHDPKYLGMLRLYGAFEYNKLVGMIATRSKDTHIALFFVDGKYHRKGIGKQLFQMVLKECHADKITVNSSPYAITIYHKLGFYDINIEQVVNGLKFTPMVIEITRQQGS